MSATEKSAAETRVRTALAPPKDQVFVEFDAAESDRHPQAFAVLQRLGYVAAGARGLAYTDAGRRGSSDCVDPKDSCRSILLARIRRGTIQNFKIAASSGDYNAQITYDVDAHSDAAGDAGAAFASSGALSCGSGTTRWRGAATAWTAQVSSGLNTDPGSQTDILLAECPSLTPE